MRLFLVRHGESVDNVAGLYAGSRDSPLTTHGILQARRLGAHLASRAASIGPITRIFASNLQRASKTAEAILEAQKDVSTGKPAQPGVVQLADLREKDFGSLEGTRFGVKGEGSSGTNAPSSDPESQEQMKVRVNRFIEVYLRPILLNQSDSHSVVVVAHGIILNVLLGSLLLKFSPDELARLSGSEAERWRTELLASWSNTGYLEAVVRHNRVPTEVSPAGQAFPIQDQAQVGSDLANVTAVNCVEHLQGLKRTRGGIGSAKFDDKQRTVDSFFGPAAKKKKTDG